MGRPKADPEQHHLAAELFRQGYKPKDITYEIELSFPSPVSLSTVEKWCRGFKRKPIGEAALDSKFRWEFMDEAKIPWEAAEYLLEVWTWLTEVKKGNPPTFGHMKWWWRVHLASPNMEFQETLEAVVQAEIAVSASEVKDEFFMTTVLANGHSKPQDDDGRFRLRDLVLRARGLQ